MKFCKYFSEWVCNRWWFSNVFYFQTPIWGRFPILAIIFFKWVETTNQVCKTPPHEHPKDLISTDFQRDWFAQTLWIESTCFYIKTPPPKKNSLLIRVGWDRNETFKYDLGEDGNQANVLRSTAANSGAKVANLGRSCMIHIYYWLYWPVPYFGGCINTCWYIPSYSL